MNYTTRTIQLPYRLSEGANVRFLDAIVFEAPRLPFAIVHYTVDGGAQPLGLRLDLDKQVFLDHFADADDEATASVAASHIVTFLGAPGETALAAAQTH